MTVLRNSQLPITSVNGGTGNLDVSQLAIISVGSNPAADDLRVSQLFVVAVIANGSNFQPLGPVVKLGCWTPCGVLMWNG